MPKKYATDHTSRLNELLEVFFISLRLYICRFKEHNDMPHMTNKIVSLHYTMYSLTNETKHMNFSNFSFVEKVLIASFQEIACKRHNLSGCVDGRRCLYLRFSSRFRTYIFCFLCQLLHLHFLQV